MAFSIENFTGQVFGGGLARENRFRVTMPNKVSGEQLVSLFCESTSIPQLSVITKQQRLFGPSHVRAATIDYGGAGLAMTFLVDREMKVKKWFDAWMHLCVNPGEFTVKYLNQYAGDITIEQLDEKDNVTYAIKLIGAFPTACGPLSLNHGSLDTFHRLPVTFTYRYWETSSIQNTGVEELLPKGVTSTWSDGTGLKKPVSTGQIEDVTGDFTAYEPSDFR